MGGTTSTGARAAKHPLLQGPQTLWRVFRNLKVWQYLLILVPLLFLTATLLRFDHLHMLDLRTAVLQADESADDAAIATALQNLKDFAEHHTLITIVEKNGSQTLTFGTGPLYLEHQYYRHAGAKLQAAEEKAAGGGDSNPNGNIYAQVKAICEPQALANGWQWNTPEFIACWTENLAKFPATDSLDTQFQAELPSTGLYRYDFASPVWAPTLAGFAMLLCALLIAVIFIRFLIWLVLRLSLLFLK